MKTILLNVDDDALTEIQANVVIRGLSQLTDGMNVVDEFVVLICTALATNRPMITIGQQGKPVGGLKPPSPRQKGKGAEKVKRAG